jgi:CDP-diacylglycerol--glycerol-3-phosphate 3-phosphatidyltransferase
MSLLERSTLPNIITVSRIAAGPIILLLLFIPSFAARLVAWILFLAAAFSDLWDGWLARKHGWISDFGKLVDPIADKALLVATLVPVYVLSHRPGPEGHLPLLGGLPLWIVLVIFGREALVTALRWWLARKGVVLPAGKEGKLKAVFQNIFIGATLFWLALRTAGERLGWNSMFWDFWMGFHGFILLTTMCIAVCLTVFSMFAYLWQWRRVMQEAA